MNKYPLEWLDSIVLQLFNVNKIHTVDLSKNDLIVINNTVVKETKNIQVHIKNDFFSIQKKREIRLLVRKYHNTLIYLLDMTIEHRKRVDIKMPVLLKISEILISSIEELISFIEDRFSTYLSLDERVPITYLMLSKNELSFKLKNLGLTKNKATFNQKLVDIIISKLQEEIQSLKGSKITYRQILYQRALLKEMENVLRVKRSEIPYSNVDKLLIEMNFNCVAYINYFTENIVNQLNSCTTLNEKRELLLFYYKEFRQLHSNETVSFDLSKYPIKYVLDDWFIVEISYLEESISVDSQKITVDNKNSKPVQNTLINKIKCILSADQIALILRAGDESRIIKARSMSQVFKTIVPYLSTSQKVDLSYDSMRSKSYSAEDRDKEIAIQTLERLIKHIRAY